jgi:hypothetical protein
MKRDSNFLFYELMTQKPDWKVQPIFSKMNPSFIEQLELRGYDLTTLKFSIMKKQVPETEAQP